MDSVAPGLCPDWEDWDPDAPVENASEAMDLADKWLNVPKLLTPEEIVNPNVDEQVAGAFYYTPNYFLV